MADLTPEQRALTVCPRCGGKITSLVAIPHSEWECTASLRGRLASAECDRDEARAQKDGAYRERDQVVALVARMALALGWRAGLRRHEPDPDPAWDEDWKNVVAIDLPTGQVTWHYHDSERPLFSSLPPYPASWDGHDTAEKYRRVGAALPSEAGRETGAKTGKGTEWIADQLTEDIWQGSSGHGLLLDVGWYPDGDPTGHFVCREIVGEDWVNPRSQFSTTAIRDVIGWIAEHARHGDTFRGASPGTPSAETRTKP